MADKTIPNSYCFDTRIQVKPSKTLAADGVLLFSGLPILNSHRVFLGEEGGKGDEDQIAGFNSFGLADSLAFRSGAGSSSGCGSADPSSEQELSRLKNEQAQ